MRVRFYQSECGDAASIRFFDKENLPHNIFIDAGYERTFRHVLAKDIQEINSKGELIDLWIISHIHDDHIGGVIAYLNAIKSGEIIDIVKDWLYNVPRKVIPTLKQKDFLISEAKSIPQGDTLSEYLKNRNKLPKNDVISELSPFNLFGLDIFILSPNVTTLQRLRNKFRSKKTMFRYSNELDSISETKAAAKYDYHIPLVDFDLQIWSEDDSIENGSSISILTSYEGKNILWLADSHPSIIVESLRKLGYSSNKPLICDWVKVSHHGSVGNNSNDLYEMIQCENYLFSTNGENKHCLPTKECISRILRNKKRMPNSHYHLHFTYENPLIKSIFNVDGDKIFEVYNFSVHYPKGSSKMIEI